jgi:pyruvate/2-oxoglutarate/acetoin dehydrogenase E1 component
VLAPATPADIDAALHAALTGGDPTVIVDHVLLAEVRGPVPDRPAPRPAPTLLRDGPDALIAAGSVMVQRALAAADLLADEGSAVAVLDLPVVAPAPVAELLEAVRGHRAVVFADESRSAGSPSSHLMAALLSRRGDVRAALVCTADAPAPFALDLLDEIVPTVARIADETRDLIRGATR